MLYGCLISVGLQAAPESVVLTLNAAEISSKFTCCVWILCWKPSDCEVH